MATYEGHLGRIYFDGATVTIEKTARGRVQFPAAAVSSVMLIPAGFGMRGIKFTVSGGTDPRSVKPMGSHKDVAADPYALTFRKKKSAEFEQLAHVIEAARARR